MRFGGVCPFRTLGLSILVKIPTFHLQRIDMKIRHEQVPRDNRLRPIA